MPPKIYTSKIPPLYPPKCNILDCLFPPHEEPLDIPIWINANDTTHSLSPKVALSWAKRFGFGLQRLGVKEGEVCMIFTPNHIFVPVSYWGTVGIGAAFSGANPTFTAKEVEYQISTLQPKVLLVHPSILQTARIAARKAGLAESSIYLFTDQPIPAIEGIQDWRTILGTEEEGAAWQWKKLTPHEAETTVAAINFSSGTTGLPKGVMLSHYNVIANVHQIKSIYDFSDTERWVGFLPLYHAYGQCYGIMMATILHIPMLVVAKFDFEEYLRLVQTHRVARMQTVPPILIMLNKRPETAKYNLSSVKEVLCGAAPLSRALEKEVAEKFKVRVTQGWGMSETTCAVSGVPWDEEQRTGSVGVIMPNTEIRLLDDEGRDVEVGERGEIFVKGPQVALGYWRNPEATREAFDCNGGWLKSGDMAVINEEGWMWIVDRKKELIKVQALQVAPAEIEATLLEHPDVADAGVVGVTLHDEEWPRAYVALKPVDERAVQGVTEAQLAEWLKERVSKHKWLVGGVMFVEEVPRLPSGKIQRRVMRQWAARDREVLERRGKL